LSDKDILDLTLIVGYFNFVNRVAVGLGVDFSDDEKHGYLND
jgi:alkylhydroperoxidase family enzyme